MFTFAYPDRIDVDRFFTDVNGADTRYAFLSLFSDLSDLQLGYSFKDVLSIFLTKPSKNIGALLDTQEMNYGDFSERARWFNMYRPELLHGLGDILHRGIEQRVRRDGQEPLRVLKVPRL
jgi:hypothetical protein